MVTVKETMVVELSGEWESAIDANNTIRILNFPLWIFMSYLMRWKQSHLNVYLVEIY